ncbi:MAG: DUF1800 domain-containing protein [Pseudomonadota bacterium]
MGDPVRDFDPQLAEMRFGYGLSPSVAPPVDASAMLDGLRGPDEMAARYPIEPFDTFRLRMVEVAKAADLRRKNRGTETAKEARKTRNLLNRTAREDMFRWAGHTFLRRVWTPSGFRERLVAFWADHFTAHGKRGVVRRATQSYIEEAIRPHVAGTFDDMLQAAVLHPLMLDYLDQLRSMGPNSIRAQRKGPAKAAGLNENLAREVLELHTLGVDGPYSQEDVTQLAELFTGLAFQPQNGFKFRKDFVEPGAETVLGKTYADATNIQPIREVLSDLAAHPATARHIAWKLAVHFIADDPPADLIDGIEAAYLDTGGDLSALYAALLDHPAAWAPDLQNVKPPVDFMSSALRALALPDDAVTVLNEKDMRRVFAEPLVQMGQEWERPTGPDGWPEEDPAWITPQGLAARVAWAMRAPEYLLGTLPDPRVFVDHALGGQATEPVRFAAAAAESKSEAIGLVLMSPAFQRR